MAGESAFRVEGTIVEALPNKTYWAELSNGHKVLAFVAGRAARSAAGFVPGNKVKLQMSPYDLSEGRIIGEAKTN
jgi:translation initiation factor IF-1